MSTGHNDNPIHDTYLIASAPGASDSQLYLPSLSGTCRLDLHPFSDHSTATAVSYAAERHLFDDSFSEKLVLDPRPDTTSDTDICEVDYVQQLDRLIERLKVGEADKVVFSRRLTQKRRIGVLEYYRALVEAYPEAYVYLTRLPNGEMWIGATPETLVRRDREGFHTMSLAGTRIAADSWTDKEYEEQAIVTEDIISRLKAIGVQQIETIGPFDLRAAELIHLCTEIRFDYAGAEEEVCTALHPTPAVCGRPRAAAQEMIQHTEGYDRRYYTGYIGVLESDSSAYYVNLRCARLLPDAAILFVGGGITSRSIAVKEWQETEHKSTTLNRFL